MPDMDQLKQPLVTVRCGNCGTVFRNVLWMPGHVCKRCGSTEMSPVTARGQYDYERADRSAGYTLEDIRFGRLAQWAEYATPKQVQRALHMQDQAAKAGQKVPDIGSLLMRDKIITREQCELILRARRIKPRSKEDIDFGESAKRMGYVTGEQLAGLFRQQEATDNAGNDAAPLPLLLAEKRYAQENQILALLKAAERQKTGLLWRLKGAPAGEEEKKPSLASKLLGSSPSQRRSVIALLILTPVLLLILLSRTEILSGGYAITRCDKCGGERAEPENSTWPVKCVNCGETAVYPLAMCKQCGTRYIIKEAGYGAVCPKCRSSDRLMLRNDNEAEADLILRKVNDKSNREALTEQ